MSANICIDFAEYVEFFFEQIGYAALSKHNLLVIFKIKKNAVNSLF